jgi:hypothetical protein
VGWFGEFDGDQRIAGHPAPGGDVRRRAGAVGNDLQDLTGLHRLHRLEHQDEQLAATLLASVEPLVHYLLHLAIPEGAHIAAPRRI